MKNKTKLKNLIKKKYMKISENGDFTLSSGKKSKLYFDIKALMLDPVGAPLVGTEMRKLILKNNPDCDKYGILGGLELGAALLSPIMAMNGFNTFILRKKSKKHGLQDRLIGYIDWYKSVIIIDDVITTGKSVKKVEDYFIRTCNAYCIIDRTEDEKYMSLFKEKDFL